MTLEATGEQTAGSIGVLEATSPPGTGPPRHVHHGCDELFYVLEGEFLFLLGERRVSGPPGTFVFVPRGTVHAAKVVGTEPGRVLAAYVPGGLERSFEEFAELRTEQAEGAGRSAAGGGRTAAETNEKVAEINQKYDSEFVGPPL